MDLFALATVTTRPDEAGGPPPTKIYKLRDNLAYARRRTAEGKTKREILRCLKRYIAREVYNTLQADLADLHAPPSVRTATTIICGAGPIGMTRRPT